MDETPARTLDRPLALGGETLPNRLAKAAMTEGLADAAGRPTESLVRLYRAWGHGGAGLLLTGNVIVDRAHLERPGNVILDREPDTEMRHRLAEWAHAAREGGAGCWVQLSHAGRQTPRSVNPRPKAPSAVPVGLPGRQFGMPEPLAEAEILALVARFADAAEAVQEAGFTGVQVHAAHGYLLSSFLSPRANLREDEWGGPLENRARLLLEIVRRVRARTGASFSLSVKLNSADFQRGGFSPEESLQVASWLEMEGVDVLEISGGSYEQPRMMNVDGLEAPFVPAALASTVAREGYFLDFAVALRDQVHVPLLVTGGFRSAAGMAKAVEEGIALVGLARPLCVDPSGAARILGGARDLERHEDRLRLAGGWLGPRSPFAALRALNGFAVQGWYYQQIRRLAAGQGADPALGVLAAFRQEQATQRAALAASRRRRT